MSPEPDWKDVTLQSIAMEFNNRYWKDLTSIEKNVTSILRDVGYLRVEAGGDPSKKQFFAVFHPPGT